MNIINSAIIAAPLALSLVACGASSTYTIEQQRTVNDPHARFGQSSDQRFAPPQRQQAHGGQASTAGPSVGASTASSAPFTWVLPPGWTELPPTSMRVANFQPADGVTCYASITSGGAASLLDNVNRWRGQMGLDALDEQGFADLPKITVLDSPAVVVDATAADGNRLLGLLCADEAQVISLKMTGPAAAVDAQAEAFMLLAGSLERRAAPTPIPRAMAWTAPSHWQQGAEHSMRLATYHPHGNEQLTLTVSVFGGDIAANLNRWRGQLGLEALDAAGIAALPTVNLLGQAVPLLHGTGTWQGMSGAAAEGFALLGVARPFAGSRTLFVKMTGPAELIAAEREHFSAFCRSISEDQE
ncbi:MAG: hypothetical protein ACYTF0_05530 [Planctomycetota bacterium]|jgi:hypothetical protein